MDYKTPNDIIDLCTRHNLQLCINKHHVSIVNNIGPYIVAEGSDDTYRLMACAYNMCVAKLKADKLWIKE